MKACCNADKCEPVKMSPPAEIVAGMQEVKLTNEDLQTYKTAFLDNIKRGLGKETNPAATVKCFPTYVQDLPNGTERGTFLALDLEGGKFRIAMLNILEDTFEQESDEYALTPKHMTGSGKQLFDYIAMCLGFFVLANKLEEHELPLAFTFSFPCTQKELNVSILSRWAKGFSCEDVPGEDVGRLLQEAISRSGYHIKVVAIINDTTGTLVACAFKNPACRIGLIIGTNTNVSYWEKQENAELFDAPDGGSGGVIINCESGAFGDDGALDYCVTAYDRMINRASPNLGKQTYEKMISGLYLGELVRLAIERFTKDKKMFGGKGSEMLFTRGSFETRYIFEIESMPPGDCKKVREICDKLGITGATEKDYASMRYICERFSRRAAYLVSAQLSVLIEKVGEKTCVIGVDGALYKEHPHFHEILMRKVRELTDESFEFDIMLSEDGAGIGAALVAATTDRVSKERDGS